MKGIISLLRRFDLVFGSLGAMASFLFWIYLSSNIVLLGPEVASVYTRTQLGDYDAVPSGTQIPLKEKTRRLVRGLLLKDDKGGGTNTG